MVNDSELKLLLARCGLSFEGYRKVRRGVKIRPRHKNQELNFRSLRKADPTTSLPAGSPKSLLGKWHKYIPIQKRYVVSGSYP